MASLPKTMVCALTALGLSAAPLHAGPAVADDFTVEALLASVSARHVHTVEAAVALLPVDLRSNYALVFASRSLQGATLAAPRAILFGSNAQFIVSFNGEAVERGYEALETMQYDPRSHTFHFREIVFSDAADGAQVSADNPARCTACHGNPARPIWDTPPSWPGVYGERYGAGLSRVEAAGMRDFLSHQATSARYSQLVGLARYADRSTYVASSRARYSGEGFEPPNARLSTLLATLNVRALVAQLAAQPAFSPHRYALLEAAGGGCGSVEAFFPPGARDEVAQALVAFQQSSSVSGIRQATAKRSRLGGATDAYRGGIAASDPVVLRFIAERLVGLPPQRWSLALEGASYDLAAPDGALTLEQFMFDRIAGGEPELRALRTYRSYTPTDAYCAELRRRSQHELSQFYAATGSGALAASTPDQTVHDPLRPPLLESCIGCHTGDVGPALPFAETAALRLQLARTGYSHGRLLDEILFRLTAQAGAARMPRGINATADEQQSLEAYFIRIASGGAAAGR